MPLNPDYYMDPNTGAISPKQTLNGKPKALGLPPDFSKFFGGRLWINIHNESDQEQKFKLFPEDGVLPNGIKVNFVLFSANAHNHSESETRGFYELLHELISTQDFYIYAVRTLITGGAGVPGNSFSISNQISLFTFPMEEKASSWRLGNGTDLDCVVNPMTQVTIELSYSKAESWDDHSQFINDHDYHLRKELESTLFDSGDALIIENRSTYKSITVDLFDFNFEALQFNDDIYVNSLRRYRRFCKMVQQQPIKVSSLRIMSDNEDQLTQVLTIHTSNAYGSKQSSLVNPTPPPANAFMLGHIDYSTEFILNGKTWIALTILPGTSIQLLPIIEAQQTVTKNDVMGKAPNTMFGNPKISPPARTTLIKPSPPPIQKASNPATGNSPLSGPSFTDDIGPMGNYFEDNPFDNNP